MVDLAVSLASGKPALGKFPVPQPRRVAIVSGESGGERLKSHFKAVASAIDIKNPGALPLHWLLTLPRMSFEEHVAALTDRIRARHLEVLFLDPAYLSVFGDLELAKQAPSMFVVGPLLKAIWDMCHAEGCTLILAHHTGVQGARSLAPMELHELAYSGFDLFARQWWLLRRREPYESNGQHQLWLSIGGSSGFSSA